MNLPSFPSKDANTALSVLSSQLYPLDISTGSSMSLKHADKVSPFSRFPQLSADTVKVVTQICGKALLLLLRMLFV